MFNRITFLLGIFILLLIVGCGQGGGVTGIPGPTGLYPSNITTTSFILHWSPIPEADYYTVYKDGGLYVSGITGTSQSITGLSPGRRYRMTVSYTKDEIESNQSASLYVTTSGTTETLSQ